MENIGNLGVVTLFIMSVLEFMNIYSGAIVALCAIGGLVCTVIGLIWKRQKRKAL